MLDKESTFMQQINIANYGSEYLNKREKILSKIGNELENLEHMEEIRKILVNANDEELDIAMWITKTKEYEELPPMQRAEYFLYKAACTGIVKRVDLFEGYLKKRDKVASVIGKYNTYLMEEILEFQFLCISISSFGIYRFWTVIQVAKKRENIGPFLNDKIYSFTDEIFSDLVLFSKSIFLDNEISKEEKISIVQQHIELLCMIDNNSKLKEIYYRLCTYSYTDKEILNTIKSLDCKNDK